MIALGFILIYCCLYSFRTWAGLLDLRCIRCLGMPRLFYANVWFYLQATLTAVFCWLSCSSIFRAGFIIDLQLHFWFLHRALSLRRILLLSWICWLCAEFAPNSWLLRWPFWCSSVPSPQDQKYSAIKKCSRDLRQSKLFQTALNGLKISARINCAELWSELAFWCLILFVLIVCLFTFASM